MFFIMGIQDREKIQNYADKKFPCHICGGHEGYRVYDWYNMFHVFFIPLWKWGHMYRFQCMTCNSIYVLKESNGKKVSEIIENPTYWDLALLETAQNTQNALMCEYCGFELSNEFDYCPKCGKEIKRK